MANKKTNTKSKEIKHNFIQEQKITQTLEENYMPYAMSVIVSRAIPEIDGFKPSHRKLLYTMYLMNLLKDDRTKSSNVVGQTMKLNPHGDGAIYETLVRLTEGNEALLAPFIDSKGSFGKQFSRDMAYAAPRYTEVKLAHICNEIFNDIDKNTVNFIDNFDGKLQEPTLLPTTFPNILANSNLGIAVGMASSICSFNLSELCQATISYIKDPEVSLLDVLPAPDFPSGGKLIYNQKDLSQIYETGRGSFKLHGKYTFDKKNSCIDIYEIPYTTTIENIMDKILVLVKSGKIRDITDIRDETDLKGLKLTIDIKRNTDPELLMRKLFSLTPLSDTFSCNFNLLIHGRPMTLGVRDILKYWTEFRVESISRQLEFDIKKKSDKYHLLEGLGKILLDIDKAISIIRHTEEEAKVVPNLVDGFDIDAIQGEYIAEIKLRNINKEYILRRTQELETLAKEIEDLKNTLKSQTKIKNIICKQLTHVSKKYGKPRKTEIVQQDEIKTISKEDMIDNYQIKLFLTKDNYFKKIPISSLRSSGEQKLKEDDEIIFEIEASNRSEILFFSSEYNLYKMKTHEFSDTKASILGDYLPNILGIDEKEKILYMITINEYKGYMIYCYENGKISKVPLNLYETKTKRKKITSAYYSKSPLVAMKLITEDEDILLVRGQDKSALFSTNLIPESSTKSATGLSIFNLKSLTPITNVIFCGKGISSLTHTSVISMEHLEEYRVKKLPTIGHFIHSTK